MKYGDDCLYYYGSEFSEYDLAPIALPGKYLGEREGMAIVLDTLDREVEVRPSRVYPLDLELALAWKEYRILAAQVGRLKLSLLRGEIPSGNWRTG